MEAISIPDAGDFAKQSSLAVVVWKDVFNVWNAAQIGPIELETTKQDSRYGKGWEPGAGVLVVVHIQRIVPTHGFMCLVGGIERRQQR